MFKSKRKTVMLLLAASLTAVFTGCHTKSPEDQIKEAADAVNAAIGTSLSLESFDFTITRSVLLNDEAYEADKTTYIGTKAGNGTDYYISTLSANASDTVEHLLLGQNHYLRFTNKETGEFYDPHFGDSAKEAPAHLSEKGWYSQPKNADEQGGDNYHINRLWIRGKQIRPEDFASVTESRSNGATTYTFSRSREQLSQLSLAASYYYENAQKYYDEKLADDGLPRYDRIPLEAERQEMEELFNSPENMKPRTAETLEAVVDQEGRLLRIRYQCDYEAAEGKTPAGDDLTVTADSWLIVLNRFNDDTIKLPD